MHQDKTIAGPSGCARGGQEIDLPDEEAKAAIKAGFASPVRGAEVERAVSAPQETATKEKKGHGR